MQKNGSSTTANNDQFSSVKQPRHGVSDSRIIQATIHPMRALSLLKPLSDPHLNMHALPPAVFVLLQLFTDTCLSHQSCQCRLYHKHVCSNVPAGDHYRVLICFLISIAMPMLITSFLSTSDTTRLILFF